MSEHTTTSNETSSSGKSSTSPCRDCGADKGENLWYCDACWHNHPSVTVHVSSPDGIQGAGSMLDIEGETKYRKRLERRKQILADAKRHGKTNIKPSELRRLGA